VYAEGDSDEAVQAEIETAVEVWQTLLEKLQVEAEVTATLSEPDDLTERQIPVLDLNGRDLSMLIGPRGETLAAFQYITRLMVSHQLKQRSHFMVDVEGYRERRKQALARLAERMAHKVVKRGKPVTLEPMPAFERRAIHIALRDNEAVYTQSTGEGRGRRVRIYPKR